MKILESMLRLFAERRLPLNALAAAEILLSDTRYAVAALAAQPGPGRDGYRSFIVDGLHIDGEWDWWGVRIDFGDGRREILSSPVHSPDDPAVWHGGLPLVDKVWVVDVLRGRRIGP